MTKTLKVTVSGAEKDVFEFEALLQMVELFQTGRGDNDPFGALRSSMELMEWARNHAEKLRLVK